VRAELESVLAFSRPKQNPGVSDLSTFHSRTKDAAQPGGASGSDSRAANTSCAQHCCTAVGPQTHATACPGCVRRDARLGARDVCSIASASRDALGYIWTDVEASKVRPDGQAAGHIRTGQGKSTSASEQRRGRSDGVTARPVRCLVLATKKLVVKKQPTAACL
jgi:hypothetical protein